MLIASKRDVPFLVLTDGNRWDFFLGTAKDSPAEHRFRHLEFLRERDIPECADFLKKHIGKDRIVSGEAKRSAEALLASDLKRRRSRDAIRSAWRALLEEPDEMLRDLLAERVESDCGTPPEPDDAETFLRGLCSARRGAFATTRAVGDEAESVRFLRALPGDFDAIRAPGGYSPARVFRR